MVTRAENDEIAWVVVQLVSIYMVYVLGWFQRPTEHFLHNEAVDSYMFAIYIFAMVSIGVHPAVSFILSGHNIVEASVVVKASVVFLAVTFTILFPFAVSYTAFSFLRAVRSYQCFFWVTVCSVARVVHLAQSVAIYVARTSIHCAWSSGEQTDTACCRIMSLAVSAFDFRSLTFWPRTVQSSHSLNSWCFHLEPPFGKFIPFAGACQL